MASTAQVTNKDAEGTTIEDDEAETAQYVAGLRL